MSFKDRYDKYMDLLDRDDLKHIVPLEAQLAKTPADVQKTHKKYTKAGHEGTVIRAPEAPYEIGKRSKKVLKLKDFITEEYEITGFKEGKGKEVGQIIFIVKTKKGQRFDVRPEGTAAERRAMFKKGSSYVGKLLTVKFFELTAKGIPRFPVGIKGGIRDYE